MTPPKIRPTNCPKCQSTDLVVQWCQGVEDSRHDKKITGIDGTHGFVCTTEEEHFHFFCQDCGFAQYN